MLAGHDRELIAEVSELYRKRLAENTRRAYNSGWRDFTQFCEQLGRCPLPASVETVAMYLASRNGEHAPSTLSQRLAAIRYVHEETGEESPTHTTPIKGVMEGIRRNSDHTKNEAPPLLTRHVKKMVDALEEVRLSEEEGNRLRALRDQAIILIGYAGALRRSEIAGIRKRHLKNLDEGYALLIPESKNDQEGKGEYVGITRSGTDYCPCTNLEEWIVQAGVEEGPVFRGVHWSGSVHDDGITPKTVNNAVQDAAEEAEIHLYPSAHSLRAGHVTQATINGVPDGVIRAQSRHKDPSTFFQYQRVHKALSESGSRHLDI